MEQVSSIYTCDGRQARRSDRLAFPSDGFDISSTLSWASVRIFHTTDIMGTNVKPLRLAGNQAVRRLTTTYPIAQINVW